MMQHPSHNGLNLKNTTEPEYPDSFDQFNPKGNVAALRNVIHGQLDMKTPTGKAPTGNSSRYQKPAPPPVDPTPPWAKNVKVYEPNGYVDPHMNKHNMGRVLDGPVNPNKFFQGVPPPSYSQVKPETKPPVPPSSKPPLQTPAQALQAQVLQNEKPPVDPYRNSASSSSKTSYRIPYDVAMDPRHHFGGEFDIDDSASIISSSCTFGDSSEIAAFSAAAEQRHLYEQYKKKLMEEKNELKEGSETPCVSLSEKAPVTSSDPEPTVSRSLFDTELTPFGHSTSQKTQNPQETSNPFSLQTIQNPQKSPEASKPHTNPFATPSPNPFNYSPTEKELKRSIDLESSQLLVKPKSPAPYSTSSSDHYGTIRRKHKPVAIDLTDSSSKSSPKDRSPHFFGNNFEEKSVNRSPLTPSYKEKNLVKDNDSLNESLNQAFEIASAIESTKSNYDAPPTPKSLTNDRSISDTYPVSSQWGGGSIPSTTTTPPTTTTMSQKEPELPPGSMSNSIMSTSVPNMDESIVFNPSADSSPDRHEDMSQWYRKMFKQMHKKGEQPLDNNNERFGDNNNRPSVEQPSGNNLGRSQENLNQNQNRRSKTPESSSYFDPFEHGSTSTTTTKRYIPRPPHFHLPTYRFRDEDPRPHRCSFNNCVMKTNKYGTPCMMCDRPKKDVEFKDIDLVYENMKKMKKDQRQRSQNSLDLMRITNNLDETTKSLNLFLQQIDATWKRSKSQPTMRLTKGPSEQNYGQERVKSNEDELLRLRAEKLAEELKKEKDRKHGFVPSATPSLQNNMDRLNSLLYDFSNDQQETNHKDYAQQPVMTATAVYKFEPRSSRELPLNRGDIVRIIRDVDAYWMEGERNGRTGIFPNTYVQINSGTQSDSQKMRAIYPFTARSDTELSLKRGEVVTRRRQIDSNWLEGSNQIGIVGIFPASYVEPLEVTVPEVIPQTVFPNRPKTPKIEDQVFTPYKPVEQVHQVQHQPYPVQQQYPQYNQPQHHQPQQQPVTTVVPNNKVRFDLPSSSESNLNMSLDQVHYPTHQSSYSGGGGMKKIEYEREQPKVDEEPILEQYRKLNETPMETKKKDNNILMNAAQLIPKGSEMYRAVYPYQPQKDDELQLFTNDIIFVVERCDDGWYIGTSLRTGEFGIFPGNYVKRH